MKTRAGARLAICSSLLFLALGDASAHAARKHGPSPYDVGYFTDSDQLQLPKHRMAGATGGSPPSVRQAFCARTLEDAVLPFAREADYYDDLERKEDEIRDKIRWFYQNKKECGNDPAFQAEYLKVAKELDDISNRIYFTEHPSKAVDASLSFNNPDGWLHTGLCWFHSRFQRSATYLARFVPNAPKPTREEAIQKIAALTRMDHVVEIPGFRNLREFSEAYKDEIISALNAWSIASTPRLLSRLGDVSEEDNPEVVRQKLQALYDRWKESHDILFVRYRIGGDPVGALSHSRLILKIEPVYEKLSPGDPGFGLPPKVVGYRFLDIDSNGASKPSWIEVRFNDKRSWPAKCYADFDDDLDSIHEALKDYCGA